MWPGWPHRKQTGSWALMLPWLSLYNVYPVSPCRAACTLPLLPWLCRCHSTNLASTVLWVLLQPPVVVPELVSLGAWGQPIPSHHAMLQILSLQNYCKYPSWVWLCPWDFPSALPKKGGGVGETLFRLAKLLHSLPSLWGFGGHDVRQKPNFLVRCLCNL